MSSTVGRYAPSPSGRMHLGNLCCCLLAWLSAKSSGGKVVLRIEDLDAVRCPREFADLLEADLAWLGLAADEGGSKGDINVTRAAQAVQGAMQKASPGSSWVIQAWGGNPSRELLAGTDPRHALVLQLTKDMAGGEKNLRTFDGIPWVWCELANFGGNT